MDVVEAQKQVECPQGREIQKQVKAKELSILFLLIIDKWEVL